MTTATIPAPAGISSQDEAPVLVVDSVFKQYGNGTVALDDTTFSVMPGEFVSIVGALDLSFTHTDGRWRAPGSWVGRDFPDIQIYQEVALLAERGCIDMLFWGDGTGIPDTWEGSLDEAVKWGVQWPRQDMSPFIAALSQMTKNIGFGLTYSSTFMHPFYVSRLLNSLDHITKGRIAFNVVASTRRADAANYGFDELMEHDSRYDRMEEFVDVCKSLWASVEPDAIIRDRETGVFADPSKVHRLNHRGRFFNVRGPLNSVPSPQGRPVLVQAGASPRGIQASAHFADMVFAAGGTMQSMARRRSMLDEALVAKSRNPASVGVLWDLEIIVAESEDQVERKRQQVAETLPREAAGAYLSHNSGYDFSTLPDRFVIGELAERITQSNASQFGFVHRLAQELGPGVEMEREEFFEIGWRAATGVDHMLAGTAPKVADELEEIFEAMDCRGGFMIAHPMATPRAVVDVIDFLVPELQRRGRFRKKYEASTLRDNLGISFEAPSWELSKRHAVTAAV
jgi:FMN-dependent oxidoreductase (nitrilotriacetate monooxygenase family)